jgi:hypothetical protein
MTALERVRRTQRILGVAAVGQALAWGITAALGIVILTSLASLAFPRFRTDTAFHGIAPIIEAVTVMALLLWRRRHFVSMDRVALWIEERIPELQYSLVTAAENGRHGGSPFAEEMEHAVARQNITGVTLAALRRGVLTAVAALIATALILYVSTSGVGGAGTFSRLGRFGATSTVPAGSRLEDIQVRITLPAYAGGRVTTLDDPSTIPALVGSTISIRGKGSATGLTASVSGALRVAGGDGGWAVSLVMPHNPAPLTLRDRNYERVIVLDPRADALPKIALTSPLRDTTLRAARLVVHLSATATDDIGLAVGHFEYLITTGSGEVFKARTITTPVVQFGGNRSGSLSATLDLASLQLVEGDIVSMRALVQDGNTLSGPGVATSDTRTIRIARADEYDSLAIEAAAPAPLDSSALSQRMLIAMTEQLVREQPKLTHEELVKRSTEIGDLEDRVRKRVEEILGGAENVPAQAQAGDAPTVEQMEGTEENTGPKNADLKAAYDALWEAVRSLQIAEPAPALPPMRVALKALDRARVANRLYLRGTPPKIIVDLQRVRLSGKEKGSANSRTPRSFADSARARLSARFAGVLDLIEKQPARAMTELAMMRVDALSSVLDFAAALGQVTDAIRAGRDATLPLLRARRALDGPPSASPGLPQWTGG